MACGNSARQGLLYHTLSGSPVQARVSTWRHTATCGLVGYNSNTPRQHRDAAYFRVKPDFSLVRQPYKNPTDKRIAERIARGYEGAKCYDWMEFNQVKNVSKKANANGVTHPCQMPEEVMRRLVGIIPDEYVIVDPFLGSGTTAIAAIRLKRHFIGFELDREYFNIAQNRIRKELAQPSLF